MRGGCALLLPNVKRCLPAISFPFSGCDRYLFTIRGNKYFVVVVGRGVVGRGACGSKFEVCL